MPCSVPRSMIDAKLPRRRHVDEQNWRTAPNALVVETATKLVKSTLTDKSPRVLIIPAGRRCGRGSVPTSAAQFFTTMYCNRKDDGDYAMFVVALLGLLAMGAIVWLRQM